MKLVLLSCLTVLFLPPTKGRLMNVALWKPAYMSSVYENNASNASNGVDGILSTHAITYNDKSEKWFLVDLMKKFIIQHVILLCYKLHRIYKKILIVGLSDHFDKEVDKPVRGQYYLCGMWLIEFTGYADFSHRMNCRGKVARYVILQSGSPEKPLFITEMEVYAENFNIKKAYMGCYRELSGKYKKLANVTNVVDCLTICKKENKYFAVIKSASDCFCSDQLPNNAIPSSQCSLKCSSDKNPCGNFSLYSAYQTEPVEKTHKKYIGCYQDDPYRDMPFRYDDNSNMTIELCLITCLKNGYSYAGLQSGYVCFCGEFYGFYKKAKGCNEPCKGNRSQICGGEVKNSVYEACYTYEGLLDTCSTDFNNCPNYTFPSSKCGPGWMKITTFLRNCSVDNGGCGEHKCEEYRVGEVETNECVCNEGYSKRSYNHKCQDINECLTYPCNYFQFCKNTPGSFSCNIFPVLKWGIVISSAEFCLLLLLIGLYKGYRLLKKKQQTQQKESIENIEIEPPKTSNAKIEEEEVQKEIKIDSIETYNTKKGETKISKKTEIKPPKTANTKKKAKKVSKETGKERLGTSKSKKRERKQNLKQ